MLKSISKLRTLHDEAKDKFDQLPKDKNSLSQAKGHSNILRMRMD